MVTELQTGPCVVMEVSHKNESPDIVADFRNLCGPMDPVSINCFNCFAPCYWHIYLIQDIARQIRPNTLRAKYGKTKVQNAVHCSDLPEDGILEVIKILVIWILITCIFCDLCWYCESFQVEYFFKILDGIWTTKYIIYNINS